MSVTLWTVLPTSIFYFVCHIIKKGKCDPGELFMFVVNVTGGVTGIYIFLGAFDVIKVSPQNGLWGGITGLILTLLTLQNILIELRELFSPQVRPSDHPGEAESEPLRARHPERRSK